MPPIEPLNIPRLGMENGHGSVRVRALFSNITAWGPGNYTVNKIRADLSTLRLDLYLTIPKVNVIGGYEVSGNVLLFPIQSKGSFMAQFGKCFSPLIRDWNEMEIKNAVKIFVETTEKCN